MFIRFLYWFSEFVLEKHCVKYVYRGHIKRYKPTRAEIIQFRLCSRLHFRLQNFLRNHRIKRRHKIYLEAIASEIKDTF